MTDAELKHFGIPGMKWGKRKATSTNPNKQIQKLRKKNENLGFKKARAERTKQRAGANAAAGYAVMTAITGATLAEAVRTKNVKSIVAAGTAYVAVMAEIKAEHARAKYKPDKIQEMINRNEKMIETLKQEIGGSNNE